MTYDLLIKGGRVLDPARGLDGQFDIAVTGGKIARIEAGIPAEATARVLDAAGQPFPEVAEADRFTGPGQGETRSRSG